MSDEKAARSCTMATGPRPDTDQSRPWLLATRGPGRRRSGATPSRVRAAARVDERRWGGAWVVRNPSRHRRVTGRG